MNTDTQTLSGSSTAGSLLLVDDEENILSALRRLLRRDGYRIFTATGGEQGLAILRQESIDVIISDQRMPNMTGTQFLREARRIHPDTVRIVLSGYTELQSITGAINEGAVYKFLTKPWEDEQLRSNVAEAMRRKHLDDENRRLHLSLQATHGQLRNLLDERQRRIQIDEASLRFAQECIEATPLPIIGTDDEQTIMLANQAAKDLFASPLLGDNLAHLLPHDLDFQQDCLDTPITLGRRELKLRRRPIDKSDAQRGWVWTFCPGSAP